MRGHAVALGAALGGVAATLLTFLYDSTPSGLVGAVWYGFPLTWLRRLIIAPQLNPWVVDYLGLAADVVFWAIVVAVVLLVLGRLGTRKSKSIS